MSNYPPNWQQGSQQQHIPYGHGPYGYATAPPSYTKPAVVNWFLAYAIFMALLYLLCFVAGILILTLGADALADSGQDPMEAKIQGWVLLVIGLPLAIAFAVGAMLPRRPWVWIYDLVLIALGLTSVCCMPATIPLLIFWIKSETKVWFGRSA